MCNLSIVNSRIIPDRLNVAMYAMCSHVYLNLIFRYIGTCIKSLRAVCTSIYIYV